MCLFSTPKAPAVVERNDIDPSIQDEADRKRRRRMGQMGQASTVLTSQLGDTAPVSAKPKQLLGQ